MVEVQIDPQGRADVKAYISALPNKSRDEQIAFNEGVMCAAFALGSYIDGTRGLTTNELVVLERAFKSMTGMKVKIIHQIGNQSNVTR